MLIPSKIRKTHLAIAISSLICLPADAATILFNSTADDGDGPYCTIREAIDSIVNETLEPGCFIIEGDFNDKDTVLPFNIGLNPTITLTSELSITESMIINASELESLTIDGNNSSRVFDISNQSKSYLDNITVTGGNAVSSGGGIRISDALLGMLNCTISGNSANGNGGGVAILYSGFLSENTTIKNNSAAQSGGGVYASSGLTALNDSTISGNFAGKRGGGVLINNQKSQASRFYNSTISNNTAATVGGGLQLASDADLELDNSTVSGNSAISGGGMAVEFDSALTLLSSTITNNSAYMNGGGIISSGDLTTISFQNNIISGNDANEGIEIHNTGASFVGTHNLLGSSSISSNAAFVDVNLGGNPITATSDGNRPTPLASILGPLEDNGGLTLTHALKPSSPAINNGSQGSCFDIDQRSESRDDGKCDIGSFEAEEEVTCFVIPIDNKAVTFCL